MSAYDVTSLVPRLAALASLQTTLASERSTHEAAWQQRRLVLAEGGRRSVDRQRMELAASDPAAAGEAAAAAERAIAKRRLEQVAAAAARLRRQGREAFDRQLVAQRAAEDAAARMRMAANAGQRSEVLRSLAALRQRAQEIEGEVHRQASRIGGTLPPFSGGEAPEVPLGTDAGRSLGALTAQLDQLAVMLPRLVSGWPARFSRPFGRITLQVLGVLPAAALVAALPGLAIIPWAGGLLLACQLAVYLSLRQVRPHHLQRLAFLRDTLKSVAGRASAIERLAADPTGSLKRPSLDALVSASQLSDEAQRAVRDGAEKALAALRERETRLRTRIERSSPRREAEARRLALAAATASHEALAARLAAAAAAAQGEIASADHAWAAERDRLDATLAQAQAELETCLAAARAQQAGEHPPWSDPVWAAFRSAEVWPGGLPLGRVSLGSLDLPIALPYPGAANLVIHAGPERHAAAIDVLAGVVLRGLLATPPGRVKLTLIDPVGLGQSFAPLLALIDQGEAVLPGGVATDDARIERALDDLCAHLEAVIRSRLRGKYETLADYNREAGDLQEPLRLVAVADFPAGFGERASERLGVLLRTGARCGVHVLLHHDTRTRLAPAIDGTLTQHAAVVLREAEGRLAVDHQALRGGFFTSEALPAPGVAARLVAIAGAAAVRANKLEVAFASVAPSAAEIWSQSSAERLRVPIGVRGAGQLQHLELGRGTAQHVLIGGRTGSGKSTLLHVLVTSAALWFHPRELEVHLIDFKKGVEFQAYAATRLPHARVVAVESDREFGLSVLRRLDGELARRGELFRAVGAQDLAAHRRSGGEHLPRILLLIDEFQEFFTEDDTVARDAALLLDRFVRQGRAFGVHVVLGSQTLSGSYSLAKSSLGQMGVRIVLPCNEADAHLLLHEDNDATRLLTRSGEAIYNDQAGLAEGNSPFQVCWLSDAQRSEALSPLAARAAADGWKPSTPTVIFAGDAPARIDEDAALTALLAGAPVPRMEAAIGQSSSLRGSAEVFFAAASGGNLLLVGQHREAAGATLAALAIGLAARHPLGGLRLCAFDGEEADGSFAGLWTALGTTLPHGATRCGGRELAPALDELSGLLARRQSGEDPSRTPVLLAVHALQRLRALRPDDDAPFDRSGEPLSDRFAKLLAGGPEYAIHAAVWCDSLAGVQRSLSRKSLRDFDLRICFQMSPADSTELIDDDAASRLGLHSAVLATLTEGKREKFRPYQTPDATFLTRIGAALRAR
jgi:hypothetical protein